MSDEESTGTEVSVLWTNIEKRMKALGIATPAKLAELSGVSRPVITNVRKNPNKSINAPTACALARTLKCRVPWLVENEGLMSDSSDSRYNRLMLGVPVLSLLDMVDIEPAELVENADNAELSESDFVERINCPAENREGVFAVRISSDKGSFAAGGILYFQVNVKPSSGQLVIARTSEGAAPEILEYVHSHNRHFLKSLSEDVPPDLKFVEIQSTDMILAKFVCYALIP